MKKINKDVLYEILQYLLMIIIIFECNSVYSQIYGIHLAIRAIMTGIAILSVILLIFLKKIKIHKQISKLVIGFIIYNILCSIIMFVNTESFSGKGIIVLVFLIFLPLLQIYLSNLTKDEVKKLLQKFVDIVIILSIVSLMFWVLSNVLSILKPSNIVKILWGEPFSLIKSYFNLHFDTQDVWWITGTPLIRNTGVFTEGPMYAVILLVALMFNNFLCFENTKNNFIKTSILFITMITTISMTGVICASIIVAYSIIKNILLTNKLNKRLVTIIFIIAIIVIIPVAIFLLSKKMNTGSVAHRNMDIQIGLSAFAEKPILGYGVNHERATETDYNAGYGYSNTIIPVLTDGGLILAIIYTMPTVFLLIQSIKNRKNNHILFSLIYIIILFTTLIQYRLLMMLLININYLLLCNYHLKEREI